MRLRSHLRFHLIAALLLLGCAFALPCAADVLKITIDGPIHPIAEEYIARAITAAERRHSEVVLIELRTPGGLVDSTLHGQTGIVTRAETPASVAEGVLALLSQPADYDRLRVNAWERSKTFAWPKVLPPACDWLEQQARRRSSAGR